MALVAFDGTPLVVVGAPNREGALSLGTAAGTATLLDATAEACIMIAQIANTDGGSHTIDTTGSSSLGWLSGALTFANASTIVKVGLANLDTAAGPPGRAVNVANVITMVVSKSLTGGGGGITASLWQEHVPDAGTKTIANGDFVAFCVQMVTAAGADSVNVQGAATPSGVAPNMPAVTNYVAAAYTIAVKLPNFVITYSDGTRGYPFGAHVYLTGTTTTTWNNGSATKEYGNFIRMPPPAMVYGIMTNCGVSGNTDFVLYSDPLGTPVAQKTVSLDLNVVGSANLNRWQPLMFAAPYSATANQPLACITKPTSATNIISPYKTYNIAAHQGAETLGSTNCYAISRASGAFAQINAGKDRYAIGLLVGGFDDGASAGGGGFPASRIRSGM